MCTEKTQRFRRNYWPTWPTGVLTISLALIAVPALAQSASSWPGRQSAPAPAARAIDPAVQDSPDRGDQTKDEREKKNGDQASGTSNDRLFWALPNYLTVENAEQLPPLTTKQKYAVTFRTAFDVSEFPWYGFIAGIRQAGDADPSYGGGASGYAKRYALTFVDGTIENLMVSAVAASAFHLDPRYYQLGMGSAWHRTAYSVSRIVVTRSDAGHARFNYAEILGSAGAAGLFTAYHPPEDQTVKAMLTGWASQVGYDTLAIVLKEFWPDIRRRVGHH